jgi:hypothetical protein
MVVGNGPATETQLYRAVWKLLGFIEPLGPDYRRESTAKLWFHEYQNVLTDLEDVLSTWTEAIERFEDGRFNFWAKVARAAAMPTSRAARQFQSSPGYQLLTMTCREIQRSIEAGQQIRQAESDDFALPQSVAAEVMLKIKPNRQPDDAAGKRARKRLEAKGVIACTDRGQRREKAGEGGTGKQARSARYKYVAGDLHDEDQHDGIPI